MSQRFPDTDPGNSTSRAQPYLHLFTTSADRHQQHHHISRWFRDIRLQDTQAHYFRFALNTSLPRARQLVQSHALYQPFRAACEQATCDLASGRHRRHPDRHPPERTVGAIVVPAYNASGRVHFHGWIRIPTIAIADTCEIPIDEHGQGLPIVGPVALSHWVHHLIGHQDAPFHASWPYLTSLWIHHEHQHAVPDDAHTPDAAETYLEQSRDGELRMLADAELVPTRLFARLEASASGTDTSSITPRDPR